MTSTGISPARPWFKFFPSHWLSDPALRSLPLAEQGLVINCIALMHSAVPRGHLRLPNGDTFTESSLARVIGQDPAQVRTLLAAVLKAKVFDKIDGVIICRKVIRDEARALTNRENGKRGGNPKLRDGLTGGLTGVDKHNIIYPLSSPRRRQASQEEEVGEGGPFGAHDPLAEGDAA